ncbi:hypothetical protein BMS3Bbin15_00916 [archaeon BMS3Bbin15]|nr:hypothetical protein BMS3Bbin15_00916 [archaeon BMS3Bbin15]
MRIVSDTSSLIILEKSEAIFISVLALPADIAAVM